MEPVGSHDQEQVRDTRIVGQPQVAEGQGEHHHAKKPTKVLKKVKEKAKKIKDTLTKHGHGHDHDHDHDHGYGQSDRVSDDQAMNEEDDEDEEMEEVPEVHGAPIYESIVATGSVTGQPESLSHPGKGISTAPVYDPIGFKDSAIADPTKTFVHGEEEFPGQPKVNLVRPRGLEEDPAAPKKEPDAYNTPSNYQSKVTDPTGKGDEADMKPIIRSFDKMKVYDHEAEHEVKIKPEPEPEKKFLTRTDGTLSQFSTGSHDQFSPEPIPSKPLNVSPENHPDPETLDMKKSEHAPYDKTSKQGGYSDKISSATSAIADKAISAKNAVVSKPGRGEIEETETEHREITGKTTSVSEYGKKMATTLTEKIRPVYEKVAGAGSGVMLKMQGRGETEGEVGDKGVSAREYVAEKLRPREEDKALSDVISGVLHKRKEEYSDENVVDDDGKRRGKVTESKEVAERVGTGEGAEKGVVDKVKSWFGKSGESRNSSRR